MSAECCNVHCISAGEGMSSMATLMNTAMDTLANAMYKVTTTIHPADVNVNPTQHASFDAKTNVPTAIALIKANEDLSNNEFSNATECLMKNLIATVYIAMSNQPSCSMYICKQVNGFQGLDAA